MLKSLRSTERIGSAELLVSVSGGESSVELVSVVART